MRPMLTATVLAAAVPILVHPDPRRFASRPSVSFPHWMADTGRDTIRDTTARADSLPLATSRTVSFDVTEGTWLSLDVSPDGRTIVFELLGDLYTLPIGGGAAKRLTSGLAFDSQPRYSPDGKWIAFLSDREGSENVWIIKADGTDPKQLSKDTSSEFASPAWIPDGQYVIVSRSGWALRTYELWMYHVQGGSGVQITKAKPEPKTPGPQRHNAMGVSVSADGRYLYYARKLGGFQYNAQFPMWQIARRDRRTGEEDILTQALGSAVRPAVSPRSPVPGGGCRSEEHTSELQSRSDLVCRLLLEKKTTCLQVY